MKALTEDQTLSLLIGTCSESVLLQSQGIELDRVEDPSKA